MPFSRIRKEQLTGLQNNINKKNTVPGVMINFREHNRTFFIEIDKLLEFIEKSNKKSINIIDLEGISLEIDGVKKISRYKYNLEPLGCI